MQKNDGVTATERYLKKLCDRTFLSLWSHVGIFNDKKPGQEICDLLIIFENHVIIFSDKNIQFQTSGDLNHKWSRWYRKSILESAKQIAGAERWILTYPNRLFLDQSCKTRFPLSIPDNPTVHRILVTHSITEHCKEYFNGGSGSLMFDSECKGDERPFTIGQISLNGQFIHVLDDNSLHILLNTLDTAPDFIEYLVKKENFLTSGLSVTSSGEEEFLAYYLASENEQGEHDFLFKEDISKFGGIIFQEGFWEEFSNSKQRLIQLQANKISYFWDYLIEDITGHIVNGTTYKNTAIGLLENERMLRLLARENRTKRRFLSDSFLQFTNKVPQNQRSTRTVEPTKSDETYYVFLALPKQSSTTEEQYRIFRRELLAT